jgi:hypothetical protein
MQLLKIETTRHDYVGMAHTNHQNLQRGLNKEQHKPNKKLLHCDKAKSYHKTFKRKIMEETLNPSKTLKLKKILKGFLHQK